MHCMKCGQDIPYGQVFCDRCLEVMDKYPVKPGVVVQIPNRPVTAVQKKSGIRRRNLLTPEEQVKRLRKRVRILSLVLTLFIAATCVLGYFTAKQYIDNIDKVLPGQNYSSIEEPSDSGH